MKTDSAGVLGTVLGSWLTASELAFLEQTGTWTGRGNFITTAVRKPAGQVFEPDICSSLEEFVARAAKLEKDKMAAALFRKKDSVELVIYGRRVPCCDYLIEISRTRGRIFSSVNFTLIETLAGIASRLSLKRGSGNAFLHAREDRISAFILGDERKRLFELPVTPEKAMLLMKIEDQDLFRLGLLACVSEICTPGNGVLDKLFEKPLPGDIGLLCALAPFVSHADRKKITEEIFLKEKVFPENDGDRKKSILLASALVNAGEKSAELKKLLSREYLRGQEAFPACSVIDTLNPAREEDLVALTYALLKAPSPFTRLRAAESAARNPSFYGLTPFLHALKDPFVEVRRIAIIALSATGAPSNVPYLVQMLGSEDRVSRLLAARALAETGVPPAMRAGLRKAVDELVCYSPSGFCERILPPESFLEPVFEEMAIGYAKASFPPSTVFSEDELWFLQRGRIFASARGMASAGTLSFFTTAPEGREIGRKKCTGSQSSVKGETRGEILKDRLIERFERARTDTGKKKILTGIKGHKDASSIRLFSRIVTDSRNYSSGIVKLAIEGLGRSDWPPALRWLEKLSDNPDYSLDLSEAIRRLNREKKKRKILGRLAGTVREIETGFELIESRQEIIPEEKLFEEVISIAEEKDPRIAPFLAPLSLRYTAIAEKLLHVSCVLPFEAVVEYQKMVIEKSLTDKTSLPVLLVAIDALSRTGRTADAAFLKPLLSHEDERVFRAVLDAARRLGAVDFLAGIMVDFEGEKRFQAGLLLSEAPSMFRTARISTALDLLEKEVLAGRFPVSKYFSAVKKAGLEIAGAKIEGMLCGAGAEDPEAILEASRLCPEAVVRAVEKQSLTSSLSFEGRLASLLALFLDGRISEMDTISKISNIFENADESRTRRLAAGVLAGMETERASTILIQFAGTCPEKEIRSRAVLACCYLKKSMARTFLLKELEGAQPSYEAICDCLARNSFFLDSIFRRKLMEVALVKIGGDPFQLITRLLGFLSTPDILEEISFYLMDERLRVVAAAILKEARDRRILPYLKKIESAGGEIESCLVSDIRHYYARHSECSVHDMT